MSSKRAKMTVYDDGSEEYCACPVPGCDNHVALARRAAGMNTCIELHGQKAKQYTILQVPKSNGVVGNIEEAKGLASSHKGTAPSALESSDWWMEFGVRMREPSSAKPLADEPLLVKGLSNDLTRLILAANQGAGGVYCHGNLGMREGYIKGVLTSATEPTRLTKLGEIVRHSLLHGRLLDFDQLVKLRAS